MSNWFWPSLAVMVIAIMFALTFEAKFDGIDYTDPTAQQIKACEEIRNIQNEKFCLQKILK